MSRSRLLELRKVVHERGEPTREQVSFARIEEQCINQMYPLQKPADERREQTRRTLEKYIGRHAIEALLEEHAISLS
jgi:hypothetical protein